MNISAKQKNRMLAAADLVDKGEMAVLEKILEFMDYFDTWQEEIKALKAEMQETLPSQLNDKLSEMSREMDSKLSEISLFRSDMDKMMTDHELNEEKHAEMMNKMQSDLASLSKKMIADIAEVKGLIPEMPEETDLTDIYNRLVEIEGKIPKIPEELTAYQVRDKLESIEEEKEKLKIEAIQNLEERLKKLEDRPIGKTGGGTSAMAVAHAFKYIAHTEQPTGAIDGVNTTYTVKNVIWWVAGFTLNGEPIAELPNFTFINHTITFATALPAAYSGKDFEIKYIGT